MSKKIRYTTVFGCPKHGNIKGKNVTLKFGQEDKVSKSCYKCEICKTYFLHVLSGEIGTIREDFDGYKIQTAVCPIPVPKKMYVYSDKNKICDCKKKRKYISYNKLILSNGSVESIPGMKYCRKCERLFISKNTYEVVKEKLISNNIDIVYTDNDINQIGIQKITKKNQVNNVNDMCEDELITEIFEEKSENVFDYTGEYQYLKKADRVACAYYDADIMYNPYQYLPWLKMYINNENDLLISDEVGLGKTIEAGILIMEELVDKLGARIMIVCPAFLREKWYYELKEKFQIEAQVYDSKNEVDEYMNVVILPLSRIKQYIDNSKMFDYSMIIVDEVHYFKNSKSKRYAHLKKLLENVGEAKHVFMSATPVNNSGNDFFSIKQLFGHEPYKTNTTKRQAYISLPKRSVYEIYVDLSEEEQEYYDVTDLLHPFSGTIYRHIGSSCLYALGKYVSSDDMSTEVKNELNQTFEELSDGLNFELEENEFIAMLRRKNLPDEDTKLNRLKSLLMSFPKGSKIVIFSHYIEIVKYLHSKLENEYETGYIYANNLSSNIVCRNKNNKFEDAKRWFAMDNAKTTVLICSDSCREGIDLDMANKMINYDLPFNPSILEQRIGRIDRMSQKEDMEIYNFHVNGTYDDRLHFILATKLRFINYYANYGIGNPLNVTEEASNPMQRFIEYFGKRITAKKEFANMSNEDFILVSRLLRSIGIKIERKQELSRLKVQAMLLDGLNKNKEEVKKWFDTGEFEKITEEQLIKQKKELEELLNFPNKSAGKVFLSENVLQRIVDRANGDVEFRMKIAALIIDYEQKLATMELTGNPMLIEKKDLLSEYCFGEVDENKHIATSVIEILRREGAVVYEIK